MLRSGQVAAVHVARLDVAHQLVVGREQCFIYCQDDRGNTFFLSPEGGDRSEAPSQAITGLLGRQPVDALRSRFLKQLRVD